MVLSSAFSPDPKDLLPVLLSTLSDKSMLIPGDSVIVAVSGGPDSVTLLDLLYRIRKEWRIILHVAHLNHQLRGKASDEDADFVFQLSEKLGLPFHSKITDIKTLARTYRKSLEETGRLARQQFLYQIKSQTGATRISLGHTRSDQAETLLLRLLRGSGRTGLGSIRPIREGIWIRPLLNISRLEIETYVTFRNLKTRWDESNSNPKFFRNRIRNELLPYIKSSFSLEIEAVLARTAEILQQEDDLLESQTKDALRRTIHYHSEQKIILDIKAFFGYHISLQRRMIRYVLIELHASSEAISFRPVQRILDLLLFSSGSVQISSKLFAQRADNWLVLGRPAPHYRHRILIPGKTEIPMFGGTLETRVRTKTEIKQSLNNLGPNRACFDLSKLEGELVIRNRRSGDRFQPYGQDGTRKVSDLLIDQKTPSCLRDEIPLLVSAGKIQWVVGLRTAQPAAVTAQTRRILEVVFKGGWVGLPKP